MVEQFGPIQNQNLLGLENTPTTRPNAAAAASDTDFKNMLMDSIEEVNRLQAEADQAMTELATNKNANVSEVFTAVKKAELAFQTLMQIRNKLETAYEEIKQMRV